MDRYEIDLAYSHGNAYLDKEKDPDGEWIKYSDHEKAVKVLVDALEAIVKMNDNCSYCRLKIAEAQQALPKLEEQSDE